MNSRCRNFRRSCICDFGIAAIIDGPRCEGTVATAMFVVPLLDHDDRDQDEDEDKDEDKGKHEHQRSCKTKRN